MEREYIFLSYAKEDADVARRLHGRFTREGFQSWMDEHNLLPGQDWNSVVLGAIRRSKAFLVLLSRHSVGKTGYIQREIREALEVAERLPEGRVFIIPLRLDDCDVPERLQKWQWIDFNTKTGYARVRESLIRHAGVQPLKRKAPAPETTLSFEDPAEHFLYQLVVRSGRLLHGRVPGGYGICQGHFLAVGKKLSKPLRELKGRLSDVRKLSQETIQAVLGPDSEWKRPECLVTKIGFPLPLNAVVLANQRSARCINVDYWRLALLLARNPVAYLTKEDAPVYVADGDKLKIAIMPFKIDDEEKKAIAQWRQT